MIPELNIIRPSGLEEALDSLAQGGVRVIAGGTDMIPSLRKLREADFDLMDISQLRELRFIKEEDGRIRAGTLTTFSDILYSELLSFRGGLLQRSVKNSGTRQIRNRATLGGNITNASPAADTVPALCALDAEVVLVSSSGERRLPLAGFITGPYTTAARPQELVREILFSPLPGGSGYSFIKLARREASAISRVNVAAVLKVVSGVIEYAAVSAGSVSPGPGRIPEAEDILVGGRPSRELFTRAAEGAVAAVIEKSGVRWSTPYKEPVMKALMSRVFEESCGSRL